MMQANSLDLNDPASREALRLEQRYFEAFNQQASALEGQLAASEQHHAALKQQLHQQGLELHQQGLELHQHQQELELCHTQLAQAQEELEFNLAYLHSLEQFQHQASHSLKTQLKLMGKTVVRRLVDRLRWLLPADQLQRHKQRLKSVLRRL